MCSFFNPMLPSQRSDGVFFQSGSPIEVYYSPEQLALYSQRIKDHKASIENSIEELKRMLFDPRDNKRFNVLYNDIYDQIYIQFDSIKNEMTKNGTILLSPFQQQEIDDLINPEADDLYLYINKVFELRTTIEKCLEFQIPETLAISHPDCVQFLLDSHAAGWISFFKNSGSHGSDNHGIRISKDGSPLLKFQGNWITWDKLSNIVCYDEDSEKIVSKNDSSVVHSYISPNGFCVCDRVDYTEIFPIEEIEQEEYDRVLARAQLFFKNNEEPEPHVQKNNILQLVTTFRDYAVLKTPLTENLLHAAPQHVSIRFIDSKKRVYSFGPLMKKQETEAVINKFTILKTANCKMPIPDYEEPRPFTLKRVTSIPISDQSLARVIEFVNEQNKNGFRFNFLVQNCSKFAEEVVACAGYRVSVRISPGELIWRTLPPIKAVPYIGTPISEIRNIINQIPIISLETTTPKLIKKVVKPVIDLNLFVLKKIKTIFLNSMIIGFGGRTMHSPLLPGVEDNRENKERMATFSTLFQRPTDLFKDDLFDFKYPLAFVDWQERQDSTVVYKDEGIKLYL